MEAVQEDTQVQSQTQPESKSRDDGRVTQPLNGQLSGSMVRKLTPIVLIIFIIAGGAISGLYLSSLARKTAEKSPISQEEQLTPEVKQSFNQTFRDQAEGVVEKNDKLDKYAQGTHKLNRLGGESQTAFLTSSVLDLDQYVGKKVKVFGETFGSSQVGWLMDVGKVEVQ